MADSIYDLYEDNPDTYLSAVNSVLSAIGQAPVSVVDQNNPEVMMILQIVKEVNKDVQSEGWIFNQEYRLPWRPDEDGYIEIPDDVLRLDVSDGQYIKSTDVIRRPAAKADIDLPELKPKIKELIKKFIKPTPRIDESEEESKQPILSDCESDPLCPYSTITFVWDSKSYIYGAFYDKQKIEFISFPGLGDRNSQRVWVKLRPDTCDPDSFCGGLCIGEGKNAAGCTVTEAEYTCEEIADRLFELKFEGDWVCEDAREDNLDGN